MVDPQMREKGTAEPTLESATQSDWENPAVAEEENKKKTSSEDLSLQSTSSMLF
jgi:hypothetical protein